MQSSIHCGFIYVFIQSQLLANLNAIQYQQITILNKKNVIDGIYDQLYAT